MSCHIFTAHQCWLGPDRATLREVRARSTKPARIAARIARRFRSGGTRRPSRLAWGW
jgi:hypothetical protein